MSSVTDDTTIRDAVAWRDESAVAAPRVVALSWDDPFIRRSVGLMFTVAGAMSLLTAVLWGPPTVNLVGVAVVSTLTVLIGIGVLAGIEPLIVASFERVATAAIVLIAFGLLSWGDPGAPYWLVYVWPTVLVFSFFRRRDLVLHIALVGASSAAVIVTLVAVHPHFGSTLDYAPTWILLMCTVLAVGTIARVLTASVGAEELRLRRGFEDSPIGIAIVSTDHRWLELNDAVCLMLGRSRDQLIGHETAEVTHPDEEEASVETIQAMQTADEMVEFEKRYVRPDETTVSVRVSARLVHGPRGERFIYSVMHDITAQRTAEQRLRFEATHDPLTGLPNRAAILQQIETGLFDASALGGSITVMLADLDDFKVINDSLGHFVGDRALCELADRMVEGLGKWCTVGRLGGDEFVFVSRNVAGRETELGQRLLDVVNRPVLLEGLKHHVSASVGVVTSTTESTPHDMLRGADIAMYRAKASGKGSVELFGDQCRADAIERLAVEQELRGELESLTGALRVHFQPIVRMDDLRICGFEALVRWKRGDRLMVPARFVPVAEDSGLIIALGRFVLADAVTAFTSLLERRPDAADMRLHVNVSARQVGSDALVGDIEKVLDMTSLPNGSLVLEFTETALLDERRAARLCRSLRESGVGIGLDDFGTGYSALSHLRRLELDVLKIDRSFVRGLGLNTRDRAIVASTIGLAHAVGLPVVAEGVETEAQLETLRAIGCDYAQGFLFSPPVPADELDDMLDRGNLAPVFSNTP